MSNILYREQILDYLAGLLPDEYSRASEIAITQNVSIDDTVSILIELIEEGKAIKDGIYYAINPDFLAEQDKKTYTYTVNIDYVIHGCILVKAESETDARKQAEDMINNHSYSLIEDLEDTSTCEDLNIVSIELDE